MANANERTSAKFCPRCGAFYNDLKSKTCPQCFAPLEILTEDVAESLTAEQESRLSDPELAARKLAEDEKFKEQSFGGCLGIATIFLLTLILSVVIISAAFRHPFSVRSTTSGSRASAVSTTPAVQPGDVYLPAKLGSNKRLFSLTPNRFGANGSYPVYMASYSDGIDVYAVSESIGPGDIIQFRESTDNFRDGKVGIHSRVEIVAHGLDYIVFADDGSTALRAANALAR